MAAGKFPSLEETAKAVEERLSAAEEVGVKKSTSGSGRKEPASQSRKSIGDAGSEVLRRAGFFDI